MFDGINILYKVDPGNEYIPNLDLWEIKVNKKSGEQVEPNETGKLKNLDLKLSPGKYGSYTLSIKGSLHKYYNNGNNNANCFTMLQVNNAIDRLAKDLQIEVSQTEMHGLEIGVNIELPYSPGNILKNAVCYKGKHFAPIDKKRPEIGLICTLVQYELKMYDKGKQSKIQNKNILRLEIKVRKMQMLSNYGFKCLTDLKDPTKAQSLNKLFIDVFAGIVWTDTGARFEAMSNKEQKQWLALSNIRSWQKIEKRKAYRQRNKLSLLFNQYANFDAGNELKKYYSQAWKMLFFEDVAAPKKETFLPLEYMVKRSHISKENTMPEKAIRVCVSCGRDISNQIDNSRFCSSKYVGEQAAHKCRNIDSGRRRSIKQIIKKAFIMEKFISISYKDPSGQLYTDTHAPSEILNMPRVWYDRITEIQILADPRVKHEAAEILKGNEAKQYLKQFVLLDKNELE